MIVGIVIEYVGNCQPDPEGGMSYLRTTGIYIRGRRYLHTVISCSQIIALCTTAYYCSETSLCKITKITHHDKLSLGAVKHYIYS